MKPIRNTIVHNLYCKNKSFKPLFFSFITHFTRLPWFFFIKQNSFSPKSLFRFSVINSVEEYSWHVPALFSMYYNTSSHTLFSHYYEGSRTVPRVVKPRKTKELVDSLRHEYATPSSVTTTRSIVVIVWSACVFPGAIRETLFNEETSRKRVYIA